MQFNYCTLHYALKSINYHTVQECQMTNDISLTVEALKY